MDSIHRFLVGIKPCRGWTSFGHEMTQDQVIAKDLYPVIIKGINYRHYFGNIAT